MKKEPYVSVVVEASVNDRKEQDSSVLHTLESLYHQDYPLDRVEFIISQSGWTDDWKQMILQRYPEVKIIDCPHGGYYRAKNAGIRVAQGSVIALADADCIYPRHWISTVVRKVEEGADVATGVSRFTGSSWLMRLCSFYDFHSSLIHTKTRPQRFNSNNVAFRATVIQEESYDEYFDRSGACVVLADRLMRHGKRFMFSAEQYAEHYFQNLRTHVFLHMLRNGRDLIRTREHDPQMPLGSLVRFRWLAPPLLLGVMFLSDIYNLAQNRTIIQVRWMELPLFVLFSLLVRLGESVGMYWTLLSPESIDRILRA